VQERLEGFAEVFDEMNAVDHLDGLGCPPANTIGVEDTAVPTD
jgi:hypothetical protein